MSHVSVANDRNYHSNTIDQGREEELVGCHLRWAFVKRGQILEDTHPVGSHSDAN